MNPTHSKHQWGGHQGLGNFDPLVFANNLPEPSLWNSQLGRRAFLKKTGAATVATVVVLNGMKLEVLAGVSFADPNLAIIWEDYEIDEAVDCQVGLIYTDPVYLNKEDAREFLLEKLAAFSGWAGHWVKIADSGLQDITNLTFNRHVIYQSACLPNGLSGTTIPIEYFGENGAWGAKIEFSNPMYGTVIRVIYFD